MHSVEILCYLMFCMKIANENSFTKCVGSFQMMIKINNNILPKQH